MSPSSRLVAAVDLGKTNCRVRLVRDGDPIGTVAVPGTRGLADPGGADAARAAIAAGLAELDPPGDVDVLVVGAAGREAAGAGLERRLSGLAHELVLASDSVTSHVGAFSGGAGAMVAIGTGAVGLGVGSEGLVQVDGRGYWLGDDGGGSWIGRLALRHVLDSVAGQGFPTSLVAAAEARYGDLARLPGTLTAGDQVATTTAAFARDVVAAAEAGDRTALQVLDAAGAALARTLGQAAALSGTDRVTAVGGLAGVPLILDRLRRRLPDDLTWTEPAGTSLDGAVLLAERTDLPHEPHVSRTTSGARSADSLDDLATEQVRRDLDDLDQRSPEQLVDVLLAAEATVPAAVAAARDEIAAAVALAEKAVLAGGRILYVGAGTPGRLAAQEAAEIPPTYGTDPERVVAVLAGGGPAGAKAVEGAEDREDLGRSDLEALAPGPDDLVVGIAASGRTPYVLAALQTARQQGAPTVAVVNNPGTAIAGVADVAIELLTGPEVLAGSTRMKAGTAQKVVLNVLSTGAMVRTGKSYGAWMVDLRAANDKLRRRAQRILTEATGVSDEEALAALEAAGWRTKTALVAILARVDAASAENALTTSDGRARDAVALLTGEVR
ncbi:N-acetylmuramic acid 6-phosphate etherase [Nocardioides islandensis]|uniref:N-acetylmuramic acid 6-phosphate etherase n=1 Tax=Nocardioides islandensis TaxID=433663 RepID=A0A930YER1_9ACTN|nr:N-acetylmuramic acid 6-phosphate etherase [Nocardioides islandensis]MBF4764082.1 N-acetylmuramic acid 6-phosphate etherase [Nocardioides islandensis]